MKVIHFICENWLKTVWYNFWGFTWCHNNSRWKKKTMHQQELLKLKEICMGTSHSILANNLFCFCEKEKEFCLCNFGSSRQKDISVSCPCCFMLLFSHPFPANLICFSFLLTLSFFISFIIFHPACFCRHIIWLSLLLSLPSLPNTAFSNVSLWQSLFFFS